MNKKLLAIVLAASSLSAGSVMAGVDGGQLNIGGFVTAGTCVTTINGGGKDVTVMLQTAQIADVPAMSKTAAGGFPEDINIKVDCATGNATAQNAVMSFSSMYHNSNQGTLSNDGSVQDPAGNVYIALHHVNNTGALNLVEVNNPSNQITEAFDTTTHVANFHLKASYVKSDANATVTSGHVKTNSTYTLTYN